MFQRNIRFHVEICTVKSIDSSTSDTYYVTFTLITGRFNSMAIRKIEVLCFVGQARRFKKLCEEIQALFLTSKERLAKQRRPQPSTHENRPGTSTSGYSSGSTSISSNSNTPMTPRSNASFISSLFNNTTPPCMKREKKRRQFHFETLEIRSDFNLDVKSNVQSTQPQQQQSSSSSISSLSSTSNVSLTNPPNPTGSPYSVNDDPTVESTRLKIAHRLAI
jgi:hypothetical protein